MIRSNGLRRTAAALAAVAALTGLAACGEDQPTVDDGPSDRSSAPPTAQPIDQDDDQQDGETTDAGATEPDSAGAGATTGPITVENLAARCDELTAIVTKLRGEAPATVEPSEATHANINGLRLSTAHCTYAYADDSFSDKNRVDIYLEAAPDDPAGLTKHWDEIAATERIPGIGDDASWFYQDAFDAKSSARALVGTAIISVRVTVPTDQAGAAYLKKGAAVTALKAVVARM